VTLPLKVGGISLNLYINLDSIIENEN